MLTAEEEAIVVAFCEHTLPLDDCLYALQATVPHLTHLALHRCFQRHGISRLPEIAGAMRLSIAHARRLAIACTASTGSATSTTSSTG